MHCEKRCRKSSEPWKDVQDHNIRVTNKNFRYPCRTINYKYRTFSADFHICRTSSTESACFKSSTDSKKQRFFYNRVLEFKNKLSGLGTGLSNLAARLGIDSWAPSKVYKCGLRSAPQSKAGAGSASKSKFRSCGGLKWSSGETWTLPMEVWRLKIETLRGLFRPTVADSHHFE